MEGAGVGGSRRSERTKGSAAQRWWLATLTLVVAACGPGGEQDQLATEEAGAADDFDQDESPASVTTPEEEGTSRTSSGEASATSSSSTVETRPPTTTLPRVTTTTLAVPTNAEAVRVDGKEYWCELSPSSAAVPCVLAKAAVPQTASFALADLWCESTQCYPYNPEWYFETTYDGRGYICQSASVGYSDRYDCTSYRGGPPPALISVPEVYCNDSGFGRTCSDLWYPDDLEDYELITVGGADYLCKSAWQGGLGDLDCYRYSGGNPSMVTGLVDLYCSSTFLGDCSTDWYPSVLDDYDRYQIGGSDYLCKNAFTGRYGDMNCYRYFGGAPRLAAFPDLYCSNEGGGLACDTSDYPSEWNDYSIITIGYRDYICDRGAFGDIPCVQYWGGSPSRYSFFFPDYYCSRYGSTCEPR